MVNVFFYGTLRKGGWNNHVADLVGAKFITDGTTRGVLKHDGSLPYLVKGNKIVIGEVYEVDEAGLARLDHFEGHPRWYHRELVKVLVDSDKGVTIDAFVYFYPGEIKGEQVVESGNFFDIDWKTVRSRDRR